MMLSITATSGRERNQPDLRALIFLQFIFCLINKSLINCSYFLLAISQLQEESTSLLQLYASRLLHRTVMSVRLRALIISFPCIHTWTATVQALQTFGVVK